GCGLPLAETLDPANSGRWITSEPLRCHACTALGRAQANHRDHEHPHALIHVPELRPRPTEG
ncbi:MAG: hypothetical protein ACREE7_07640, partial [Dongiaceae bacterium]